MNRSYRIVFNRSSGLWQVVSELARSHGKGRGQSNAVCTIKPKTRQARSGGRTLAWSQLVAMLASVFALGNAHGFSRTGDYRVVGQDYILGITQAGALIFDSELSEHGDPYNIILGQQATGDGTLSLTRATYNIGTSASARLVAGSQGTGTVNLGSGATLRITNPLNPSTPLRAD